MDFVFGLVFGLVLGVVLVGVWVLGPAVRGLDCLVVTIVTVSAVSVRAASKASVGPVRATSFGEHGDIHHHSSCV